MCSTHGLFVLPLHQSQTSRGPYGSMDRCSGRRFHGGPHRLFIFVWTGRKPVKCKNAYERDLEAQYELSFEVVAACKVFARAAGPHDEVYESLSRGGEVDIPLVCFGSRSGDIPARLLGPTCQPVFRAAAHHQGTPQEVADREYSIFTTMFPRVRARTAASAITQSAALYLTEQLEIVPKPRKTLGGFRCCGRSITGSAISSLVYPATQDHRLFYRAVQCILLLFTGWAWPSNTSHSLVRGDRHYGSFSDD